MTISTVLQGQEEHIIKYTNRDPDVWALINYTYDWYFKHTSHQFPAPFTITPLALNSPQPTPLGTEVNQPFASPTPTRSFMQSFRYSDASSFLLSPQTSTTNLTSLISSTKEDYSALFDMYIDTVIDDMTKCSPLCMMEDLQAI